MEHFSTCTDDFAYTQIDLGGRTDALQCNCCGAYEHITGTRPSFFAADFSALERRATGHLAGSSAHRHPQFGQTPTGRVSRPQPELQRLPRRRFPDRPFPDPYEEDKLQEPGLTRDEWFRRNYEIAFRRPAPE